MTLFTFTMFMDSHILAPRNTYYSHKLNKPLILVHTQGFKKMAGYDIHGEHKEKVNLMEMWWLLKKPVEKKEKVKGKFVAKSSTSLDSLESWRSSLPQWPSWV